MFRTFQRWALRQLFLLQPEPSVVRICRAWLELEKLLIGSHELDEDTLHNFKDRIHDITHGFPDGTVSRNKRRLDFILVFLPTTELQLAFRQLVFAEETNIWEQSDSSTKLSYDYLCSMTLVGLWRYLQTADFLKRVGAVKVFWALPTIMSFMIASMILAGFISIAIIVGMVVVQGGWEKIFDPLMMLFNHMPIMVAFAVLTVVFAFISGVIGRWFAATFVKRLATQIEKDSQNNINYAHCMVALQKTNARLHNFIKRCARD